jgi:hypothetical protein
MKKMLLIFLLTLLATPASATQRVWISEFGQLAQSGQVGDKPQIAPLPVLRKQNLDTTGGVQSSAGFSGSTFFVRIVCEVQCAITGSGTAAVTDLLMPPYTPEYFGVQPGSTISVIAAP